MPNANYPASKILQLNQNNTCYTYTIIKEGFYPPSDILQYTSLRSCNNSQFKIPDDYLIQTTWGRGSSSHTVQCEINYLEKAANFKICFGDNFQTCVNSAQSATDAANAYLKVDTEPYENRRFLNPVKENEIEEPVEEETIIQLIQEEGNENQNDEDDEGNELPVISAKEGLEALEKVMTFLLQQSRDCSDEIKKLASVNNTVKKIYSDSMKQSAINDFFEK
ncbi:1304_t:CDS:2 [Entrophospora sp. SA101]|nr:1304_t:CDS:2 [Entrophospora sp. SA101]